MQSFEEQSILPNVSESYVRMLVTAQVGAIFLAVEPKSESRALLLQFLRYSLADGHRPFF